MEHERKFVKVTASRRSEARRSEAIQECHEARRGEERFQKVGRGEARRGRGWSRRGEAIPRNLASFRALAGVIPVGAQGRLFFRTERVVVDRSNIRPREPTAITK